MTPTTTSDALSFSSIPVATKEHDAALGALGAVSGAPRALLRLEGAAALAAATWAYSRLGGHWLPFAALFLVPDLSMLGYLVSRRVGAAGYNAGHSYLAPAALAAFAMALNAHALLCFACIWCAHIGFDRLLGYGLKYGTSFSDTHLGRRGPNATH
jgi:hypothetical protein